MSTIRQAAGAAYQRIVPTEARRGIYRLRRAMRTVHHDARWLLMSQPRRRRWVEGRLRLDKWYWLFILSCNNSGTTLLREILHAHPSVRGLPKEGQRLTRAIPNSAPLGIGQVFTQRLDLFRRTEVDDASTLDRLLYDWAARFSRREGVLLEKSPPNAVRSRWLQAHFRPARFIVTMQNPYAVCEGIRRRRGHSIEEAAAHWSCVYDILMQDIPYLDRSHIISYEELCRDPVTTMRGIEAFLEIEPWFDATFFKRRFAAHNITGGPRPLADLNARSIATLSSEDIEAINHVAGAAMKRLGYELLSPTRDAVAFGQNG